jgi:CheY-like chemotaxis protein
MNTNAMNPNIASRNSILIIEDDQEIREALEEILRFEGYEVGSVKNGKEGLDYLHKASAPSVILLDMMMPVMNGYQFLAAYQEEPSFSGIPVIVLSADNALEDKLKQFQVRFFLKKPIELERLLELVKQHVDISSD